MPALHSTFCRRSRGAQVHSQPETVLWFRFLCEERTMRTLAILEGSGFSGLHRHGKCCKIGVGIWSGKSETAGKVTCVCRLLSTGGASVPKKCQRYNLYEHSVPLRREGTLVSCSIQCRLVLDVIVSGHCWEQRWTVSLPAPFVPFVLPAAQQQVGVGAAWQPISSGPRAHCAKRF